MKLTGDAAKWLARLANRAPGEVLVARSIPEMRALRLALDANALEQHGRLARVGFVPTMGALHAGHLSLCDLARSGGYAAAPSTVDGQRSDFLMSSIFVNPTQFAPHEDLGTYPRTWDTDLAALSAKGADAVFAPTAAAMYPPAAPHRTFVELAGIDATPEGAARPGFFRGVATVVTKLLSAVSPTVAAFGQKDGIQCIVIKQLVRDLNLPVSIVIGPTTREADGLAMSSRNVYLSPQQRAAAPAIQRALAALVEEYRGSDQGRGQLEAAAQAAAARRASANGAGAVSAEVLAQRAAAAQQAAKGGSSANATGPEVTVNPFIASLIDKACERIASEVSDTPTMRPLYNLYWMGPLLVSYVQRRLASTPTHLWSRTPPHNVSHCRAAVTWGKSSTCACQMRSVGHPSGAWASPAPSGVPSCSQQRCGWVQRGCWITSCWWGTTRTWGSRRLGRSLALVLSQVRARRRLGQRHAILQLRTRTCTFTLKPVDRPRYRSRARFTGTGTLRILAARPRGITVEILMIIALASASFELQVDVCSCACKYCRPRLWYIYIYIDHGHGSGSLEDFAPDPAHRYHLRIFELSQAS